MLEFAIQKDRDYFARAGVLKLPPYGSNSDNIEFDERKRVVSYKKFIEFVLANERTYGAVTTRVGDDQHIMVLDCDGEDDMLAAAHWVKTELGFNYAVAASSPVGYWIITDYIDSIGAVAREMSMVPGVDPKFTYCCCKFGVITIRALPKFQQEIKITKSTNIIGSSDVETGVIYTPTFSENNLTGTAGEWLRYFEGYWANKDMAKIIKSMTLKHAIRYGKMREIAQKPSFEL